MLTELQEIYVLKAYFSGSVKIYDRTSSYSLVEDGILFLISGHEYALTTPVGTDAVQEILDRCDIPLNTESNISLTDETGNWLIVETGGSCNADKTWLFLYQVTYPRINRSDWHFFWEVPASGMDIDEATIVAEKRIEELFPGATIGSI